MALTFALTKPFLGGGSDIKQPPKNGFLLALVGEPNWAGLAEAVLDVRGSGWGGCPEAVTTAAPPSPSLGAFCAGICSLLGCLRIFPYLGAGKDLGLTLPSPSTLQTCLVSAVAE